MHNLHSYTYESDWLLVVAGIFGEGKTPSGHEIFWRRHYEKLLRHDN